MLESIIDFINLKLGLLNYFEKTHCLSTLVKNDDGLIYPAEYISNGDFEAVDFDAYDGVSYIRVNGEIDVERVAQRYTPKPRLNVTFPLRLVYAVRKDKLTKDDAYSFDRVRGSLVKQLESDSADLANQLEADRIVVSTSSYISDTKELWDEETAETGTFQPKYEVVFGAMEVSVTVTTRAECIPSECDDFESDILRTFDFCKTNTQDRLTSTQVACLTDWLCDGSGSPVTIQINGVTYTTAPAGTTYNQEFVNTDGDAVGTAANPSVVGDATIQVNGVGAGSVVAEGTYNQGFENSQGNTVGTAANPSIAGDATVTINGDSLGSEGSIPSEESNDITVNLDGSPSGSWNGTSWEVTSAACDDATVNANGVLVNNVASGGTLNIDVHDTDNNDVGTVTGTEIEIADTTIRNQANDFTDTELAEGTYTLPFLRVVDSDGSNVDTVDYKPVADGAAFTCSVADYGTRILSLLRRQYRVDALCGFSFRYIEDDWASNSEAVCRVRRSSDNSEQDFTPTEITDGTLTTFTGANDGHVVKWYDQTGNYFNLYNTTAGNQAKLVTSGVLNTDSQGNPTAITTSTVGYEIGANGSNATKLTLFSPSGAFWAVGQKNNSTSISRFISAGGNPAVGIADTTSNPNELGTGTPTTYSNGSALADQLRNTLQTAINNNETAILMVDCDWTDSGNWRTAQGILSFHAFPVGSQISEFVLDKKDWTDSTIVNLINNDLQTYYGYW